MPREVPEWIGATDDSRPPPRVMLRIFQRYNGVCQCGCGWKISGKPWQGDHIIALINGGKNRESNYQPLLIEHHKEKTKVDVAIKSKTYKVAKRHAGIKSSGRPMPGSRRSGWKKKFNTSINNGWVRR